MKKDKLTMASFNKYRNQLGLCSYNSKSIREAVSYIINNFNDSTMMIDQHLIDEAITYANPSLKSYVSFISELRNYSRYLNIIGFTAYIPDSTYAKPRIKFIPYLLTYKELTDIFDYFDDIRSHRKKITREYEYMLPLFFRLMYCCGMRPQETIKIKINDLNLDNGDIYIRETKSYKDRHIIINDDLIKMLNVYFENMVSLNQIYLFEFQGHMINLQRIRKHFMKCLETIGIKDRVRLYDFRHSFITNTIIEWSVEGENIYNLIPYLSEYVGHSDFESTYYYVHLIPENIIDCSNIDWSIINSVFPKVGDEK